MDKIFRGRGLGKTSKCIAYLLENPNSVLLVPSIMHRDKYRKLYPTIAKRIISRFEELWGQNYTEVIIDDADQLLCRMVQRYAMKLKMITMNAEIV